jgi:pimeloyl-ACP methyl ester carboxylesterase
VLRLMQNEALAYLKLGLEMQSGRRLMRGVRAEFGVVFVPGVGANETQFVEMAHSLRDDAEHFDAFDYFSLRNPKTIADDLYQFLEAQPCERFVLVGHSLGGLLARMALQRDRPPRGVAGFISICAPLHGTWRSKFVPHPALRALSPDGEVVRELMASAHRLDRWKGRVLTIGARWDQFITPWDSAFLDGHDRLELEDVAHAGSLFDPRVHSAVINLVRRAS